MSPTESLILQYLYRTNECFFSNIKNFQLTFLITLSSAVMFDRLSSTMNKSYGCCDDCFSITNQWMVFIKKECTWRTQHEVSSKYFSTICFKLNTKMPLSFFIWEIFYDSSLHSLELIKKHFYIHTSQSFPLIIKQCLLGASFRSKRKNKY